MAICSPATLEVHFLLPPASCMTHLVHFQVDGLHVWVVLWDTCELGKHLLAKVAVDQACASNEGR